MLLQARVMLLETMTRIRTAVTWSIYGEIIDRSVTRSNPPGGAISTLYSTMHFATTATDQCLFGAGQRASLGQLGVPLGLEPVVGRTFN
jgi:hypothetical protein